MFTHEIIKNYINNNNSLNIKIRVIVFITINYLKIIPNT